MGWQIFLIVWGIVGPAVVLWLDYSEILERLSAGVWYRWDTVLRALRLILGGPVFWLVRAYGLARGRH